MNGTFEEIFDTKCNEVLNHGSCGSVYDVGNGTCIKKIFNKDYANISDQGKVLETIKRLNLYNFCKLLKIFYNPQGNVVGYTMKKYHDDHLNILKLPKDYILDSYRNIYTSIMILAEHKIAVGDFKASNTFITKDGILVFDFDLYSIKEKEEYAKLINITKLNCLFNELLKRELLTTCQSEYLPKYVDKIDELFNARTTIYSLEQALFRCNRVIEFIRGANGNSKRYY